MIKAEDAAGTKQFKFDFRGRNRRPPRDAVNALLSLAYSLLAKDSRLPVMRWASILTWGSIISRASAGRRWRWI